MKRICLATVLLFSPIIVRAGIELARGGKPVAEIVRSETADEAVQFAAEELQFWIEKISGARAPIRTQLGTARQKIVLGVLGQSPLLAPIQDSFRNDAADLAGNDGYAVRTRNGIVYLFATVPKGVLNGVFRLIYRNTDLIWARPNSEFGTIYSEDADLAFSETDYLDVPVFILRGWQMHGGVTESELWQVRNGTNWSARMTVGSNPNVKRHGTIMEYGGGHNLTGLFITEKKYFEEHPEFFPEKDGKRVRPSESRYRTQLCFTNSDMTTAFLNELDTRIRANPDFTTYRVMIEDTWAQCECAECTKAITLPDGSTLEYSKDRKSPFRSTQFFMWLNQLGEHLLKHYPGKRILTFGYFFTAVPPKVPIAPNISISFCPITKDSKEPLTGPTNREWDRRFRAWMDITTQLTWREYFGLVGAFPRPMDVVALNDLGLVASRGVNRTYSEIYGDGKSPRMDGAKAWDLNAMYYWTMTNGLWNPSRQAVPELRRQFLQRVYGSGANDVREFYSLVEAAWFRTSGKSGWNDSPMKNWRKTVLEHQLMVPCRQALERAAGKVAHPNGQRMLAALRQAFEEHVTVFDKLTFRGSAAKAQATPAFNPDFDDAEWARAEALDLFLERNDAAFPDRTVVRVLHDAKALYVGAKCSDKAPDKIHGKAAGQPRDEWPVGDKFEIFLAGENAGRPCYYQLAWDSRANRYDGRNRDKAWNGTWTLKTSIGPDGWSSFVVIPWSDLGLKSAPKTVNAGFLRYWNHNSKSPKLGTWFGGDAHDLADLYPITLKP
ncbi:MAG: DUF4838 domain-containing protein [Lentisphaerae bacterium]|nr:DUF4838 domain-containing protein [Lentisphaerota bacterium]MBT4818650.1 DUF4838 domain-containing protein [Lentisphaerota bacterium]MBT5611353.1 DUF4838 domain-containing protein [Lentisphaerota bacterium]MBT7060343.1 DUF4838 domain-containing protein [Lentisphaerota bacterium]MBT7842258.1 DUF4838 domain-containing protein [Lentisphaerota bacterium]